MNDSDEDSFAVSDRDPFAISDEDAFVMSDDDDLTTQVSCSRNPVEEHLLKQLHDVQEIVEKSKINVEEARGLTKNILQKLQSRATYPESSESDDDTNAS